MAVCRYCQRSIRFVVTPGGRRIPLNVDPDPNGNVVIADGIARVLTADQLAQRGQPATRWMPHHATCEHYHRGPRR